MMTPRGRESWSGRILRRFLEDWRLLTLFLTFELVIATIFKEISTGYDTGFDTPTRTPHFFLMSFFSLLVDDYFSFHLESSTTTVRE